MILCLYGPSCSGKTTAGRAVADRLNLPLRSCGDDVRRAARKLDLAIEDLPDESHRQIDRVTVSWASDHRPCIVEGRFLDAVFGGAAVPAVLVLLVASDVHRAARLSAKTVAAADAAQINQVDAQDADFRARLYNAGNEGVPCLTIDTSELTVDECASRIVMMIKEAGLV
jgi:cytidylate kinase